MNNSNYDLSIIIVNWNTKNLLQECLLSIRRQKGVRCEVIVVDNNSSDGSQTMIPAEFPEVLLIKNTANRGFAAANNQALNIAQGKSLLLLNPDTELADDGSLQKLLAFQVSTNAGIIGPRLIYPDRKTQESVRAFPTWGSQLLLLLKVHAVLPKLSVFKKFLLPYFDYAVSQKVDQVSGACFLISKSCFDAVGFLDESFWIWFEEVDYCKRAHAMKFSTYYCADVTVVHYGGQSFQQLYPYERQKKYNASLITYAKKHFSAWQTILLKTVAPISMLLARLTPKSLRQFSYKHGNTRQ